MSLMRFALNSLSMEDDASGKIVEEKEHAFYLKISDFSVLENADEKQRIEQASFYTENKGKGSLMMRSRKIDYLVSDARQGATELVFTTKTPSAGSAGSAQMKELSVEGSEEQHALYMQYGMAIFKDRHIFKIAGTDLHWDVDVFRNKDGSYSSWCRVELEVKDLNTPVPEFPFQSQDSFSANDKERRDALRASGEVQQ